MNVPIENVNNAELTLRKAQPNDAIDIFHWRNDPLVRNMSRNSELISEASHMNWYSKAITDPKRLFLIGFLKNQNTGVVRFDYCNDALWEVNITIAPDARRKGLGGILLKLGIKHFQNVFPAASIKAVVRVNNIISIKLFQSLGFSQKTNGLEFTEFVMHADIHHIK